MDYRLLVDFLRKGCCASHSKQHDIVARLVGTSFYEDGLVPQVVCALEAVGQAFFTGLGGEGGVDRGVGGVAICHLDGCDAVAECDGLFCRTSSDEIEYGFETIGQIVAEMRRLVVRHVLPCHAHAVEVIVHEGWCCIAGLYVGCEDIECRRIGAVPEDKFFTPVTEEVGYNVRCGL